MAPITAGRTPAEALRVDIALAAGGTRLDYLARVSAARGRVRSVALGPRSVANLALGAARRK